MCTPHPHALGLKLIEKKTCKGLETWACACSSWVSTKSQRQEQKPQPQEPVDVPVPQIREEIGVSVIRLGQALTVRSLRGTVEVLQTQFADRVVDIQGEQQRAA